MVVVVVVVVVVMVVVIVVVVIVVVVMILVMVMVVGVVGNYFYISPTYQTLTLRFQKERFKKSAMTVRTVSAELSTLGSRVRWCLACAWTSFDTSEND